MDRVLRTIDANANRAGEALRVLEDAARFMLDDARLAGTCKKLRHTLSETVRQLGPIVHHRDTPGDVGTRITTRSEQQRLGLIDIAQAAADRAAQAMRVIEEYAKLTDTQAAQRIEQLRYELYAAAGRIIQRLPSGRATQWRLCLLLTESACAMDWQEVATQAIRAGVDAIQLREKNLDADELLRRANWLRETIDAQPRCKTQLIINDRLDIALACAADGVHLGQHDLPLSEARRIAGQRLIIGISTTNLTEARTAIRGGADYCGLGPMFTSTTKRKPRLAGPGYVEKFIQRWPNVCHLAIGGIDAENAKQIQQAGGRGVAVCATICQSRKPGRMTTRLMKIFS